jgi:hypothetical protein
MAIVLLMVGSAKQANTSKGGDIGAKDHKGPQKGRDRRLEVSAPEPPSLGVYWRTSHHASNSITLKMQVAAGHFGGSLNPHSGI